MKTLSKICCSCLLLLPLWAQASVVGHWQTIDDETGKAKSIVEVFERDGKLFGKVEQLLLKPNDSLCKECKGDLHNKPIVGMEILQGLKLDDDVYSGGEILDPANGKTYRCKLWLKDDGTLSVRGYIGFLFRTQTWHRVDAAQP
jgi:uncharacterized protein (DUF2147 family)